jgi:hypothetical protein
MKSIQHIVDAIESDPELLAELSGVTSREERAAILTARGIELPDADAMRADMLSVSGGGTNTTQGAVIIGAVV